MIVSVDELKRVLGIDLTDPSENDNLTRLIQAKTTWVQGETRRRFDTPILRVEYHSGHGEEVIYLQGHVDDSVEADNPSESLDPTTSVKVWRRARMEKFRDWEELVEGDDWERREDALYFKRTWQVWPWEDEFKIQYMDGYAVAPDDIKEVILELAMNQYIMDVNTSSGAAGVKSESLGDFSYSIDLASVAAGTGDISQNASKTLNRYKRRFA